MKKMLIALALAAGTAMPAMAASILEGVISDDRYYASFSGTILDNATGSAATLHWQNSEYGYTFNIGFTNSNGTLNSVLTAGGDNMALYGLNSGYGLIGSACVASSQFACVQSTGSYQNVTSLIASMNGGNGLYNGGQLQILTTAAAVPEPATWGMMILGFGMLGAAMRRRRTQVSFNA